MIALYVGNCMAHWCAPEGYTNQTVEYAIAAYGYLLNTSERRGRWHTLHEFAEIIEQNYVVDERVAFILKELRNATK